LFSNIKTAQKLLKHSIFVCKIFTPLLLKQKLLWKQKRLFSYKIFFDKVGTPLTRTICFFFFFLTLFCFFFVFFLKKIFCFLFHGANVLKKTILFNIIFFLKDSKFVVWRQHRCLFLFCLTWDSAYWWFIYAEKWPETSSSSKTSLTEKIFGKSLWR
jgi:hypothetical protein